MLSAANSPLVAGALPAEIPMAEQKAVKVKALRGFLALVGKEYREVKAGETVSLHPLLAKEVCNSNKAELVPEEVEKPKAAEKHEPPAEKHETKHEAHAKHETLHVKR